MTCVGRRRGFTLVELLVVLAIAGLLGAAILLTLPGEGRAFDAEVRRLATRLVHARQEAILGTRSVAVTVDASGHAVERRGPKGWLPLQQPPFGPVLWEDGTAPVPPDTPVRFRFDAAGGAEPAQVVLAHGDQRAGIVLGAHGEVRIDAPAR